ncbi:MAG: hypothetical protein ULS35scaffold63_39 [Phage 33_17]|nr:MAG: hypothetical protein ULS35scaffold63_39 [Phage 33_17]
MTWSTVPSFTVPTANIYRLRGQPNGIASLDQNGRVPTDQIYFDALNFKGNWNASTNTPHLQDGTGTAGDTYLVSVSGTQNLGSGNITFDINDFVLYNGETWGKSASSIVFSVNGQVGTVILDSDEIEEGSINLYYTNARSLATILSGYSSGSNVSISGTDTILQALEKIQAQINARLVASYNLSDLTNISNAQDNLELGNTSDAQFNSVKIGVGGLTETTLNVPALAGPWSPKNLYFNVNGGDRTISLAGNFSTTGNFNLLFALTANTNLTLPISGTLATLSGSETLSNKTLVAPNLGVATVTSINKLTITSPATNATLTIIEGKTLSCSNSLTLSGMDGSILNIDTGGTLGTAAYTNSSSYAPSIGSSSITTLGTVTSGTWNATAIGAIYGGTGLTSYSIGDIIYASATNTLNKRPGNPSTVSTYLKSQGNGSNATAPLWSQISASELSDGTTGSGNIVLAVSPVLTTPNLGVATATSINKLTITSPATNATLTIADGKTLTCSNSLTLSGTDSSSIAFGLGGTVIYQSNPSNTPLNLNGGVFTASSAKLNTYLQLLDIDASNYLMITNGSNLTADRILTIAPGDAARTITLTGNPTLADWFDQSVKSTASPIFNQITISNSGSNVNLSINAAVAAQGCGLFLQSAGVNKWALYKNGSGASHNFSIAKDATTEYFGIDYSTADINVTAGNLLISTVGKTLEIKSGTNAKVGTFTLNGLTNVVISNTSVTANSLILMTIQTAAGVSQGNPEIVSKSAGIGFTAKSTNASDTSLVGYLIIELI